MKSSIRTQLIISFLAVVLLSLSGLSVMQVLAGAKSAQEEINRQLTTVVTFKGQILSEWANTLTAELSATLAGEDLLTEVEAVLQEESSSPQSVSDLRTRFLIAAARSRYFYELFLMDKQGTVIVSSERSREGEEFGDETFFNLSQNVPQVSAPLYLEGEEASILFALYPIVNEQGNRIGLLAGRARTDPVLQVFADTTGMRERANAFLMDMQGRVIVGSTPAMKGQIIPDMQAALAAAGGKPLTNATVLAYTGSDDVPYTSAYIYLTDLQSVLLVEQSSEDVNRTWAATLAVNLSVTLSSILIALFIALSSTRAIANPLSELVDISSQITRAAGLAEQSLGTPAGASFSPEGPVSPPVKRPHGPLHGEARELETRARYWGNETGTLALAFNQMTLQLSGLIAGLEERVSERTAALEQNARFLEASADVSRATTQILDPDKLISQAVELIRDRYDLYYVGLFLCDSERAWAVLRSGTGAAGQAMLARNHRLRLEPTSMIGWCITNDQARIAQAASEDEVRVVNPELPDTRSEAAIPLHARGQVIGALTVQSDRIAAFTPVGLAALQTMADQLAIAINNADLFARSQQALEAERRAYAYQTQAEWSEWTRSSRLSVRGDPQGVSIITAPDGPAESKGLSIPIRVRGQTIGVIEAGRSQMQRSRSWNRDEIIFLETIAEQLGVALDSARLYAETRKRAEQERLVDDLTGKMRATLDIETVLETAAREMRMALGLAEVEVRLASPDNKAPSVDRPEGDERS